MPATMRGASLGVAVLGLAGCLFDNPAFDRGTEGGSGGGDGACAGLGDADGDGVCDPQDVCPDGDDGRDADGDGKPDACDPCPNDPAEPVSGLCGGVGGTGTGTGGGCPDADGDGVCDDVDVCPGSDDRKDSDGDGTPDGCEACVDGDADGDGVCDAVDACPGDDHADVDMDGEPDACDACPNDAMNDVDMDGLCGDLDNCPEQANGGQEDADGDGRGDACDVCNGDFPDDKADYDGDGVPCAQDPCQFDGPAPPSLPGTVGPYTEITVSNVKLNGGGNVGVVAPGAMFSVQFDWSLNFCECPNCATQALTGIGGIPGSQCFYNKGSKDNCKPWQGNATHTYQAPMQPNTYFVRFSRYWRNFCPNDIDVGGPAFAAFCVM